MINAVMSLISRAGVPVKRALAAAEASVIRAARQASTAGKEAGADDSTQPADPAVATAALLERARAALVEEPAGVDSPAFPTDALGDLAAACQAIAEEGQLEPAMAALPLLLGVGLIAQRDYSVQTLAGIKPISMYGLTLGLSGEGKTTAERAALYPHAQWEKARQAAGEKAKLRMADSTAPAIKKRLNRTPLGVAGLFTSEGGSLIGGHAMTAENKVSTGAFLNSLWDDAMLLYARASTDEDVSEPDRHLTMSVMVQPSVGASMLLDPVLADMGLLPRFFLSLPPPSAPRKGRPFEPEKHRAVAEYYARCDQLLSELNPAVPPKHNVLEFEPEALNVVKESFEYFDHEAKVGSMQIIRPFAIRATELMCRCAAILAIYAGTKKINLAHARGARRLIDYSLACWMQTLGGAPETQGNQAAYELLCYIANKQGGGPCSDIALSKSGPKLTRNNVEGVRAAVKILASLGFVERRGNHTKLRLGK